MTTITKTFDREEKLKLRTQSRHWTYKGAGKWENEPIEFNGKMVTTTWKTATVIGNVKSSIKHHVQNCKDYIETAKREIKYQRKQIKAFQEDIKCFKSDEKIELESIQREIESVDFRF